MKKFALLLLAFFTVASFAQFGGGNTANFSVSPRHINISPSGDPTHTRFFTIFNNSSSPFDFSVSESHSAVSVSQTAGSIQGFGSQTIAVYITASGPGYDSTSILVSPAGGFGGRVSIVSVSWDFIPFKTKSKVSMFNDLNLEAAVMAEVDLNGNGKIEHIEREAVTELRLNGLGIEDLSGIENFFNLRYLDVSDNAITTVPDLSELKNLLIFKANQNDISAVSELPESVKFIQMEDNNL
jgi:Leucine-rich repeat (LRR) protein